MPRCNDYSDNHDRAELLPAVGRTDAVAVMAEAVQRVVAHGGVAGDGLHDADLGRPHVVREVLVVS